MAGILQRLRRADEALGAVFDRVFPPAGNPWRHLGALAFLCLVLAVASGIVAYALFDTSVSGAYESGLRLQQDPWLLGRLLRGLHRYAADAFMLLTVLHLLREVARGHFPGTRWFSWLSGVPLLWMPWIAGLTGLWLLADERALYSVTATAEWLQALPLSADLLARNFLTQEALNDRFFSLVLFVHIGVPLLTLAAVWIHVQRVSRPRLWPPRALAAGCLAMFVALALAVPVVSLGRADTGHVAAQVSLDWFFQFAHPLANAVSAQAAWLLAAALTLLLAGLPWLAPKHAPAPARVNLDNCNGCARCVADCPFGAVVMVPRSDQRRHPRQASVVEDLCAACGICVGACPSSTPFRSIEELVSGIELPDAPVARLRQQLQSGIAALTGSPRLMLFACRQAAEHAALADSRTAVMPVECAAMLPPSFIEYALRLGAEGAVIAGCREGDCEFRLGDAWVRERVSGAREPQLRARVPRERVAVAWAGRDLASLRHVLASLRNRLQHG